MNYPRPGLGRDVDSIWSLSVNQRSHRCGINQCMQTMGIAATSTEDEPGTLLGGSDKVQVVCNRPSPVIHNIRDQIAKLLVLPRLMEPYSLSHSLKACSDIRLQRCGL